MGGLRGYWRGDEGGVVGVRGWWEVCFGTGWRSDAAVIGIGYM